MSQDNAEKLIRHMKKVLDATERGEYEPPLKVGFNGAITYPKGFKAAGVRAGIKEKGEDLAIIYSEQPAVAAGVFTTNVVKAAPVILSQPKLPRATARAIVVNSGNANACMGEQGMRDAYAMTSEVASLLDIDESDVFVASTGVIGRAMPMDKIHTGIKQAVETLSVDGGADAARAIMTTDTFAKEVAIEFSVIGGVKARIAGIAKGAGMICPNVATMLSFITTDLAITQEMLQKCLSESAEVSYNCLTIDGDTSTNDTVIMMANGMAGNPVIDSEGSDLTKFQILLDSVTMKLAELIADDGEGATKSVGVMVQGAKSYDDCRQIAKTIANSPLVKTALFGCDPNWGRILAAAGRAGVDFDPKAIELRLGDILLVQNGEPAQYSEQEAHEYLLQKNILIDLSVGNERWGATVMTCDFSYDYVKINAEYHT